jgi:hypothetical protein
MSTMTEYETALATVADALAADGYLLALSQAAPDKLILEIQAGPQACEDCLLPKTMMQKLCESSITSAGLETMTLQIIYPVEGQGAAAH